MKKYNVAVLTGDGIGPEIMRQALRVLHAVEKRFGIQFDLHEMPVGWAGIDAAGSALPETTLAACEAADAILFGSVGLPSRDSTIPKEERPERAALLALRKHFGLYANLRPVCLYPALRHNCPLKDSRTEGGIDILLMRELTAGLYFGQPKKTEEYVEVDEDSTTGKRTLLRATDTMTITTAEIERIAHLGFQSARLRRKKLTSVDKANVLENGILWRQVVTSISKEYPDVQLEHIFVDNAAMQLILNPTQFDVLLCENTFGDILSDEAAALAGSLGLLPSASLSEPAEEGDMPFGFYEPAGGSAPDIAGKNIANPIAQILSAAMMLRYSFREEDAARSIEKAVATVLSEGWRTGDLAPKDDCHSKIIGTEQMGELIQSQIA